VPEQNIFTVYKNTDSACIESIEFVQLGGGFYNYHFDRFFLEIATEVFKNAFIFLRMTF